MKNLPFGHVSGRVTENEHWVLFAILNEHDLRNRSVNIEAFNEIHRELRRQNPQLHIPFQQQHFLYSDLSGIDLAGANLEECTLNGTTLTNANLNGTSLMCADFSGASLRNVKARQANFLGADLTNADLSGADLTNAYNLSYEQLNGALVDETTKLPDYIDPKSEHFSPIVY